MSDINNQQRHAQLQAQMRVCLNDLAAQTRAKMIDVLERMERRPRIPGDKPLPTIGQDSRLSKDESGSIIMSSAIGVPGMSSTMDAMIDVGVELYDSRKAAFARPQDKNVLSDKQKATIRDKNRQDLAVYASLGEKLNLLDCHISCGETVGFFDPNGSLKVPTAEQAQALTLEEKYKPDNQNNNKAAAVFKPKFAA